MLASPASVQLTPCSTFPTVSTGCIPCAVPLHIGDCFNQYHGWFEDGTSLPRHCGAAAVNAVEAAALDDEVDFGGISDNEGMEGVNYVLPDNEEARRIEAVAVQRFGHGGGRGAYRQEAPAATGSGSGSGSGRTGGASRDRDNGQASDGLDSSNSGELDDIELSHSSDSD